MPGSFSISGWVHFKNYIILLTTARQSTQHPSSRKFCNRNNDYGGWFFDRHYPGQVMFSQSPSVTGGQMNQDRSNIQERSLPSVLNLNIPPAVLRVLWLSDCLLFFIFPFYQGTLTFRELRKSKAISPVFRALQLKLLIAVSAQVGPRTSATHSIYHPIYPIPIYLVLKI